MALAIQSSHNVVRLLNEIEQILGEEDLDLQRNNRQIIDIRNGNWTIDQVNEYFFSKEKDLESLYNDSKLPYKPRTDEIRSLLIKCLSLHFSDEKIMEKNDLYYKNSLEQIKDYIENALKVK